MITVFATTSARCTIIVTSTQFPVLLQLGTKLLMIFALKLLFFWWKNIIFDLGIPQNQFVELGQTEHFVVYPDDLEDLRISVTGFFFVDLKNTIQIIVSMHDVFRFREIWRSGSIGFN